MDCSPPGFSVHGDSPDKNTGVGCHALLQGIFSTQGPNPYLLRLLHLLHLQAVFLHSYHLGSQYVQTHAWAVLVAQTVKNLPEMWETWVRSLGWEDPLEKGMVTHSSIFAWRIPMDREAWRAIVHRVTKSRT